MTQPVDAGIRKDASSSSGLVHTLFRLMALIAGVTYFARLEHTNQVYQLWPIALLLMPALYSATHLQQSPASLVFILFLTFWVLRQVKFLFTAHSNKRPQVIGGLLAAIPLIDACYLAMVNAFPAALACVFIFLLMPRLHQWVAGT